MTSAKSAADRARIRGKTLRSAVLPLVALALGCLAPAASAAERREWVQLTDCRYVDQEYNDGDSFHVRCGAKEFVARLYFVDAPETSLTYPERVREQSAHFGVTLDETLRAGRQADTITRDVLQRPFVLWTRWASAAGRGKLPRYLSFVEASGQSLAEVLVARGLARTKGVTTKSPTGEPSRAQLARFEALERDARQQRRGIWATSIGGTTQKSR